MDRELDTSDCTCTGYEREATPDRCTHDLGCPVQLRWIARFHAQAQPRAMPADPRRRHVEDPRRRHTREEA